MGDVMIGRLVNEQLYRVPPEWVWGDMLNALLECDFKLLNLEAALTTSGKAAAKVFNFKSDPENASVLKAAGIDAVNLANNHTLDYDVEGLMETLEVLDEAGISHIGAGKNLEESKNPLIVDLKGISIGILGLTDNEPGWKAGEGKPGTHYVPINGIEEVEKEVRSLRNKVDLLIVSAHWGPNMRERPRAHFKEFARSLAEIGVDIFHGHSAHLFQGVEKYRDKLILYDTGDFLDDYAVDPVLRNDLSFLFLVDCDRQGVRKLSLVPSRVRNCQVERAKGKDAEESLTRMEALSLELNTPLQRENEKLSLGFFKR